MLDRIPVSSKRERRCAVEVGHAGRIAPPVEAARRAIRVAVRAHRDAGTLRSALLTVRIPPDAEAPRHAAVGDAVEKYYLMDAEGQEPARGADPEFEDGSQIIVEVGWFPLSGLHEHVQVGKLIEVLEAAGEPGR